MHTQAPSRAHTAHTSEGTCELLVPQLRIALGTRGVPVRLP